MTRYVPRPYQPSITNHILTHPRCNVFAGMGVGKTPATLEAIATLLLLGEVKRVLILAPKRVAVSTWAGEIETFNESFGHLTLAVAVGTDAERRAAVESEAEIVTINYENLTWLVENYGEKWPFQMVVADECFPAGTKVETEQGPMNIESLNAGTMVLTRKGFRRVKHVFRKFTESLVEVRTVNGASIVCTPSHEFWTSRGWQAAERLQPSDYVYSRMQGVRTAFCDRSESCDTRETGSVLRPELPIEICDPSDTHVVPRARNTGASKVARGKRSLEHGRSDARIYEAKTQRSSKGAGFDNLEEQRGQRPGAEPDRNACIATPGARLGVEPPNKNEGFVGAENTHVLQTGLRMAGEDDLLGDRRVFTQECGASTARSEKDEGFEWLRVDRVSPVKCRSGTPVFDIEVEGEHEYFAGGVLVHNCSRLKSLRVSIQTSKKGKKFLTGQGGSRAKSLARVAFTRVKRFVNLTGTPAANGLQDLWALGFFCDAGQRLGSSFTAFSHRWFRSRPGSDPQKMQIEPLPFADEQIRGAIRDISIAIEARDHFDLPPLIENDIKVTLPPAKMKLYKQMEKELFIELDGKPIEAFSAAAMTQKCLQIASGAAYTDDKGTWTLVHDEKIDALHSVVEEAAGMPVLVFYHFKSDLSRILKAFPKAEHLGSDPKTIERWNKGEIPMLVAHPQSAGHGLSLQHGSNIMCFFSSNWSLEADAQAQERAGPTRQAQSGYKRPVFVHRLVAAGTLEEVVVRRLRTKASVQDALLEAMKIAR